MLVVILTQSKGIGLLKSILLEKTKCLRKSVIIACSSIFFFFGFLLSSYVSVKINVIDFCNDLMI